MNKITKRPIADIGYGFVAASHLPEGADEYQLRNRYNKSGINYRSLTASEIETLVRNNNTSDDWNKILVSASFDPRLVKNCSFFGLVRIGKLEPFALEFHNLNLPVGLYDSTIISCDFGDNVAIHHVNYLSHYILGNEVMVANVNELAITPVAKFGNGIIRQGESESQRIWLEICNENGGRKVLPFDGMLTADAWLWSKYRNDKDLMDAFRMFTESKFDDRRGHYGFIGDRTVIKNCKMIKDVLIGTDAYIKGANKIKNVTVNSTAEASTQIGEGCELVNGIIEVGCRAFYGVKAVRFFMASYSQLKYGARLINSYLGNNSTISCCEVLNALIYPFHEQHHNNSFLCASLLMGQTNMAAGATIGSNHNSRGADGELIAGRGFWPGLCVSLKHNSRFAGFTLLAKGDFPFELNIPLPFSLVINDTTSNELRIIPAYWFQYNFYALQRNEWKYRDRDARISRELEIEYNSLAPDSVNEMFFAIRQLELLVGKAFYRTEGLSPDAETCTEKGKQLLLTKDQILDRLEVLADGYENSKRKVVLLKVAKAYASYREMIMYYAAGKLMDYTAANQENILGIFSNRLANVKRESWENLGGQLIPKSRLDEILAQVKSGVVNSWDALHAAYKHEANLLQELILDHAIACIMELQEWSASDIDSHQLKSILENHVAINQKVLHGIVNTREKDMASPFRKLVYDNLEEQQEVLGKLEDNTFILQKKKQHLQLEQDVAAMLQKIAACS